MSKTRRDPGLPPSTPRWVKILAIIFIILVIAFIILHLMGFGMGGHGLNNHTLLIEHALKLI